MQRTLLLIALLIAASNSKAQWYSSPSGTTNHLHKIAFKDASVGFCVGGGPSGIPEFGWQGIVLKTTNGGTSWNAVLLDSTVVFTELAINGDTVFAYGRSQMNPIVARSTDNGSTWVITSTSEYVQQVKVSNGALYYVDASTASLKRQLGGNVSTVCPVNWLYHVSGSRLYIVGGSQSTSYFVAKSLNHGSSWDTSFIQPNPFSPSPFTDAAIKVFGDTIIIAATYPSTIAYSYNNGASWNAHSLNGPSHYFISSPKVITGVVNGMKVVRSYNGGQSFSIQDSLPHHISQLYFVNENLGFLCGRNGMIYKTTNGGSLSISETSNEVHDIQLYPNPASSQLTVNGNFERCSLSIFNLRGEQILTKQVVGRTTTLNISSLPPGNYQLVVSRAGKSIATRLWTKH